MVAIFQGLHVYQLDCHSDEITLREQDGSGYIVRCCGAGHVEARVICASGDISEPVERTPEEFLHHHPDAAEVPGIGAALYLLACSTDGSSPEPETEGRPQRSRSAVGHFKPVFRAPRR